MGKIEISYKELKSMPEDAYQLIDLRNATNTSYGMIPGAVTVLEEDLKERVIEERNKNKKIVFYCTKGILSEKTAQNFREQGMETYSLKGGYMGWLLENMETAADHLTPSLRLLPVLPHEASAPLPSFVPY